MSLEDNEINFIQFYVPDYEIIPTELRLKFNNKVFIYHRIHQCLGYDFICVDCKTNNESLNYVTEIAELMCKQSEDKDSKWEIRTIYAIDQKEEYKIYPIIRVVFDIKTNEKGDTK